MALTPTVERRAGLLNLELEANTGLIFTFQLLDPDDHPINLTGSTLTAEVMRARCESADVLATPTLTVSGVETIQTVTTVADVSGSLGGCCFDIETDATQWRVWFDVDDGSTAPDADGRTLAEVDITADETAPDVATALAAVLDALAGLGAAAVSTTVTVTHDSDGYVDPATDGTAPLATGFTFAVAQEGSHTVQCEFTEADVDAIAGDAVWTVYRDPPTGPTLREVQGEITWVP